MSTEALTLYIKLDNFIHKEKSSHVYNTVDPGAKQLLKAITPITTTIENPTTKQHGSGSAQDISFPQQRKAIVYNILI